MGLLSERNEENFDDRKSSMSEEGAAAWGVASFFRLKQDSKIQELLN